MKSQFNLWHNLGQLRSQLSLDEPYVMLVSTNWLGIHEWWWPPLLIWQDRRGKETSAPMSNLIYPVGSWILLAVPTSFMYGTHTALTGIYMMVVPNCSHSQLDGKLADEPFLFRQVISAVSRPHTYMYHIALLLSVGSGCLISYIISGAAK